jgi:hypothetical protein
MTGVSSAEHSSAGRSRIPRSRGALVGTLLVLLGAWGVVIPFFGQEFGLSYATTGQWEWTAARGWLQVLPGLLTILGGTVLILSRNRFAALLGAWLSALAGTWFIVGRAVAETLGLSHAGAPPETSAAEAMWAELANFTGLGAVIMLLAALILGRISVRSLRDIRYADTTSVTSQPPADGSAQPHESAPSENAERLTDAAPQHDQRDQRANLFGRRNTTPAH